MSKITVSIITVCYNSARTIEQTLQSVIRQSYPHIEYIVIDGKSTDNTLSIVYPYSDKIAHLVSEPDKGIYDAMNKGISLARGEIIGFLNADDIYAHDGIIAKVVELFSTQPIDACYADLVYFSDSNPSQVVRYWQSSAFQPGLFVKGWCPPHPTFFVKKSVYERHGLFNTTYKMGNDVELMMRFLEKARISTFYCPEIWVKMRLGGASNRQLTNIWIQNQCVIQAARDLQIPFSIFQFFFYKILNRISQFLVKPQQGSHHAE